MNDCAKEKIIGYKEQSPGQIEAINRLKSLELEVLHEWEAVKHLLEKFDVRWMSVAKTHFQQGFMAAVRAVARPDGD